MRMRLGSLLASLALCAFGLGNARAQEGESPEAGERAVTEAEEREVMDEVREHNPEMAKHLLEAKERKPEFFRHKVLEIHRMRRSPEMKQLFQRNMKSEGKVRKLVEAYRRAEGREKDSARAELEAALAEQFDAKLAGHELHLKKMQEELAKQKERVAKRKAMKDQIVKKRLAELSGDVEAWDW